MSNTHFQYGDDNGVYADAEADKSFAFDDQSIRKGFIRKVYLILMVQLLITFGFVSVFTFSKATQEWAMHNPALFWIALAVMLVTMICMACCESVRRKTPLNFIFLFLFTLAESFLLGIVAGQYQADEVLMAVGITAAVSLGLTLFALQTKYDFTMCGGVLVACLVVFIIFGIIAIFIPGQIIGLVYASLGALLFSVYLVYDTQLMLGGNHRYAISPEEYIFAALNLYLDIINIFMYILTIIGLARN
ncbi:protein lifeguard 1 isoform X2 [Drosophila montana]|uniref:protein lifeguard 1 isoform X2 n=1 Tax=Drosophila montana TaxID=40370 RepID=UPI00313EF95F